MRAVINVLAAEIPHLQCDLISAAPCRQPRGDDRDAMGGIAVGLKLFSGQPTTQLRLANSAIAENQQFDLDDGLDAVLLIEEMST